MNKDPDAFRLVLLDFTLPAMNGDEVFERTHGIRPDVPVLPMSGFPSDTATRKLSGQGLGGFLQKPFTAVELARKLRRCRRLAERHRRRDRRRYVYWLCL